MRPHLQIKALNLSMHGYACMHLQLLGPGTSGTRWVHGAPHLALHLRHHNLKARPIRPIPATCTSVKVGVGGELCPGNAGGGTGRRNGRGSTSRIIAAATAAAAAAATAALAGVAAAPAGSSKRCHQIYRGINLFNNKFTVCNCFRCKDAVHNCRRNFTIFIVKSR